MDGDGRKWLDVERVGLNYIRVLKMYSFVPVVWGALEDLLVVRVLILMTQIVIVASEVPVAVWNITTPTCAIYPICVSVKIKVRRKTRTPLMRVQRCDMSIHMCTLREDLIASLNRARVLPIRSSHLFSGNMASSRRSENPWRRLRQGPFGARLPSIRHFILVYGQRYKIAVHHIELRAEMLDDIGRVDDRRHCRA